MQLSKKQDEKVLGREKTGWRFVYVLLWEKRERERGREVYCIFFKFSFLDWIHSKKKRVSLLQSGVTRAQNKMKKKGAIFLKYKPVSRVRCPVGCISRT